MPITGERVIMAMSQIGAPATLEEIARHLAKRSRQKFETVLSDVTATITGGVLYKYIDSMNGHYFNRDNVNEMLKMLEVEEMDQKPRKRKPRKKKPPARKKPKPKAAPVEFCSCVSKYCECSSSVSDSVQDSIKDSAQDSVKNSEQSTSLKKKESDSSNIHDVSVETYDDNLLCQNLMDATQSCLKKRKDLDLESIGSAKQEIGKIIDEIAGVIECQHKNSKLIIMKRGAKRPYYKVNETDLVKDALEMKQNCYESDKEEVNAFNSDCMPSSSKRAKLENQKALNKVLNEEELYNCKLPESNKCDEPNAASTNKQ